MVLPPPPPDDAPRAAEDGWLDALTSALRLSRSGVLLLVDHARQESLGELVEALVPDHPELDVHTDVQRMLDVPHGATVVLVPRAQDADWLNINRPLFAQRELRVVLFCDTETTIALAQRAVDFFDWISHRVECPVRPPRFAVAGIRTALAVRAPGIVWTGGDLQTAFRAARPRGHLHVVSAALPYAKMVDEIRAHRRAWLAWTDVDSYFRLRRVRWAHAETGHRTRAILVEPALRSPGWWPVHGRMADVREARAQLESSGVRFPGRNAALVDFEPDALAQLESRLQQSAATSPEGTDFRRLLRGEAALDITTTVETAQLRSLCLREFLTLGEQLVTRQQASRDDVSGWVAWFSTFCQELPREAFAPDLLDQVNQTDSVEFRLARGPHAPDAWSTLLFQAALLLDMEVVEYWSRLSFSESDSGAYISHAQILAIRGHASEAELLLRAHLRQVDPFPQKGSGPRSALLSSLSTVLSHQGKHLEAEKLLREELADIPETSPIGGIARAGLLQSLAAILHEQGKFQEAESAIRQAIDAVPVWSSGDRALLGSYLHELAQILMARNKDDEARAALRSALTILKQEVGTSHLLYRSVVLSLSNLYIQDGEQDTAEALLRSVLHDLDETRLADNPLSAQLLRVLASTLSAQGQFAEAESHLRQALHILDVSRLAAPLERQKLFMLLASVLLAQGRYDESELVLRRAVAFHEQEAEKRAFLLRETLLALGTLLWQHERATEAEPVLLRALALSADPSHPTNAKTLLDEFSLLLNVQLKTGSPQARDTAREMSSILDQHSELVQETPPELLARIRDTAHISTSPVGN
jgi:tetratricopeptide (TPR) repeat protein